MTKYLVILEKAEGNWGTFVPDLPGCVALGDTVEETMELMRGAIDMHLGAMVEDGDPIPEPTTLVDYVDVDVPAKKNADSKRPRTRKKVAARPND
ncbi:MAG: type II toxin-antitoxin system HicB family antitoxin [Chloroflexota bacterium]